MNIPAHKLSKALAFWALKTERRKSPLFCGRCAKPLAHHERGCRQCDVCRERAAAYRARKRQKPITVDSAELARLETRIAKVEHNLAIVQRDARASYKRGYCAGRKRGIAYGYAPDPMTRSMAMANGLRIV